ncbi:hypothetical protein AMS68_006485 [Peltaster fructicola]|uniref:Uncharacterized protein n=1 Tax=Peltaster fructicola TaxID=286661 RepID=A0A6H0Y294_9PEZI|nr:hypothetical protein AMS68_006485 [Peltaster fructicola]
MADISSVWTRKQFGTFITQRLRDDRHLVDILWRSLCYQALYPFPQKSHAIDSDGFLQAVTRLTHRKAHQSLYSLQHRREWTWKRFASMSLPTTSTIVEGDWTPPNTLDNIAQVVRSQLPVPSQPYKIRVPPVAQIRPRVQAIFGNFPAVSTAAFEISYEEMLALLTAIMRLAKSDSQVQPFFTTEDDWTTAMAVARAVLDAGQIEERDIVSWSRYLNFSETYHSDHRYERKWAFDHEITNLWNAIFDVSATSEDQSSQHPSAVVLQGLRCLDPLSLGEHDPEQRQKSILVFSSEVTSSSRQEISQAFAGEFYCKLAVIHGSSKAQDDTESDREPAILAILTAAPARNDDGYVDGFLVGEEHLILELAPVARALWFSQSETHYDDLVHITDDGLSFGTALTGLTIDLHTGTAVLTSDKHSQSYVQVAVGPAEAPLKPLEDPLPFRTEIQVGRIETYDLPGYTSEDGLSIERSRNADS